MWFFSYSEKCSENNLDMTLNFIIARNNDFVKKKSRKNYPVRLILWRTRSASGCPSLVLQTIAHVIKIYIYTLFCTR